MRPYQQNDANSLVQREKPERSFVITGSLYSHRRRAWSRAVICGRSSACWITLLLGRLWGGCGELGVKAHVHFPTPWLPPLPQCSVPLWLTGISDSWMTGKLCCFSGWLASSSPGRNYLTPKKEVLAPMRCSVGHAPFSARASMQAGQLSGCCATGWCHPTLRCESGWSASAYLGYWSVQAAFSSQMQVSQHSSTLSVGPGSLLTQTRFTKRNVNGIGSRQLVEPQQVCRSTTTQRDKSTRCFSLTREPHACPTAEIVFCLLLCWLPARMLENGGGLRVTFLS